MTKIEAMSPGVETLPETKASSKTRKDKLYQLILFDDDDHSYEYVIVMLNTLFSISPQDGERIAHEVDHVGQAIVKTCSRREANDGRDQIHRFGADPLIPNCTGSMQATVEEAT